MRRTELACYGLLASALLLAGMLIVQLQTHGSLTPEANAAMTLTRGDLTVMTARTKNKEEALFVMDNITQELHVFTLDLGKKRLKRNTTRRLDKIFGTTRRSVGGGGGGGGR